MGKPTVSHVRRSVVPWGVLLAATVVAGCSAVSHRTPPADAGRHERVVHDRVTLGGQLAAQGRYAEAERHLAGAAATAEEQLGPTHPLVGEALLALGDITREQGRFADAERLLRRAVAIFEGAPELDPSVARALLSLGVVHVEQRQYADADLAMQRALEIARERVGRRSRDVAATLARLAELRRHQRRFDDAEALFREAKDIAEGTLGPDDRLPGEIIGRLAALYTAMDRHAEAEALHRRSLAINEPRLGADHPFVALTYNALGLAVRGQGMDDAARDLFVRSAALYEQRFGRDHPELARVLVNLARLEWSERRLDEAEAAMRRAVRIRERVLPPGHPDLLVTLRLLAELLREHGRDDEARVVYDRVRVMSRVDADVDDETQRRLKRERFAGLKAYVALLAEIARRLASGPAEVAAAHAFVVAEQARAAGVQSALARAAARASMLDPAHVDLARHLDELRPRRHAVRSALASEYAHRAAGGDRSRLRALQAEATSLERQLEEATERLYRASPKYRELAAPDVLDVVHFAHPYAWAPFFLVGEGGPPRR